MTTSCGGTSGWHDQEIVMALLSPGQTGHSSGERGIAVSHHWHLGTKGSSVHICCKFQGVSENVGLSLWVMPALGHARCGTNMHWTLTFHFENTYISERRNLSSYLRHFYPPHPVLPSPSSLSFPCVPSLPGVGGDVPFPLIKCNNRHSVVTVCVLDSAPWAEDAEKKLTVQYRR